MRHSLLLAALVVLSGCSSLINGGSQSVSFTSTPVGATLTIDGIEQGTAPVVLPLSRKRSHTVEFTLDGYEPEAVRIDREFNTWVLGNVLFGGLIGIGVDALTGALYKLTPDQVEVALGETVASGDGDALMIAVVLAPQAGWEQIGQLTPTP